MSDEVLKEMDYYQRIAENFQQAIELIAMSVDSLADPIEKGSQLMTEALLQDRKIIACGNGPDGALAQLLVCNLLNRFEHERPALPAISLGLDAASLTAIATSSDIDDIFARQIGALGHSGDILVCLASGSLHNNLIRGIQAAKDRNMSVVVLTNSDNNIQLGQLLSDQDLELSVDAARQPRIIEIHTMIIQCLCEMIELSLFGSYDQE
ncbi:MAG: SIS domain-containing protein [Halioglobus sp.]